MRLRRPNHVWLIVWVVFFSACGPDTIFLRPSLDTPAQHVKNGQCLLDQGKIDAAHNEFLRAKTLNDRYVPAYVGLALVQGARGNAAAGLELLERTRSMTVDSAEVEALEDGMIRLQKLQAGE
jgi:hypothetical protein